MATPAHTTQTWRFGVFEVDARREELRRAGVPVKMREQSLRILVFLLEHAGEIVTREELRHVLWPADTFVDFAHSLNTAVMKLREALGDTADKPLYIETIPKRGVWIYRSGFAGDGSAKQQCGLPALILPVRRTAERLTCHRQPMSAQVPLGALGSSAWPERS